MDPLLRPEYVKPDCSRSSPTSPATRTMRSVHSMMPADAREKAGYGVSVAVGELSMRMDCDTERERVLLIPC